MPRDRRHQDRIAQWAFDTLPILGRFHLWLEDVEEEGSPRAAAANGDGRSGPRPFLDPGMERAFAMAAAVTALGTYLYGRYGEAKGSEDKAHVNQVKKDADAVSAYTLSEALWYLTRNLPENHALMVSLGEGLMPKAGETQEMGSNPTLGFGRVYARPRVARWLDERVRRLINQPGYGWDDFWREIGEERLTVWGAAIDTLENTSRFARGEETGPLAVLHVFDQPLRVTAPYEGYVGTLVLPRAVRKTAQESSVLLTYHTPRGRVMELIRETYPEVPPERVYVWTLRGSSRTRRLGGLWDEWRQAGATLLETGSPLPGGSAAFTDSGTYTPTFRVGPYDDDEGRPCLFVMDGYAASAEAIQAASLDPLLDTHSALAMFSSTFKLPTAAERSVMGLDAESDAFGDELRDLVRERCGDEVCGEVTDELAERYRGALREADEAGMPLGHHAVTIDDFFPSKSWQVLALSGFMLPDPYSGQPGIERLSDDTFRVTVRAAGKGAQQTVRLTLRLEKGLEDSRKVFSPLLDRFYSARKSGIEEEDFRTRPVKVSDSGRIRNELQTLASEGLEHLKGDRMRVRFSTIDDAVLAPDKKQLIREALLWYKENHPVWFSWLEIAD